MALAIRISRGDSQGKLHSVSAATLKSGMGKVQKEASVESTSTEQTSLRRADFELSTPWEEPRSEVELKLAEMWRQVLRMDAVSTADDFIDLGGDSLAATTLAAEIESNFDVRFAPGDIIELSTIAKQARALESNTPSRVPPYIVVGRTEGSKPPLFMVHGAAGFIFFKNEFLDEVGHDRPIYLFQAPGMDGRTKTFKTVQEIARAYIASMREIQPLGPYHISAMCAGSFIALEMCNQLADAGQTVAHLILLDPQPIPHALAKQYSVKNKLPYLKFLGETISNNLYDATYRLSVALRRGDDTFAREMRKRSKELKRQDAIRSRRVGDVDWANPEERSYSPEAMLEASLQLQAAVKTYVPRRYTGKAAILVRSRRARTIMGAASFWREHLSDIECRIVDANHRELFEQRIMETASFVRDTLESRN